MLPSTENFARLITPQPPNTAAHHRPVLFSTEIVELNLGDANGSLDGSILDPDSVVSSGQHEPGFHDGSPADCHRSSSRSAKNGTEGRVARIETAAQKCTGVEVVRGAGARLQEVPFKPGSKLPESPR